jgi:hypothetical protein
MWSTVALSVSISIAAVLVLGLVALLVCVSRCDLSAAVGPLAPSLGHDGPRADGYEAHADQFPHALARWGYDYQAQQVKLAGVIPPDERHPDEHRFESSEFGPFSILVTPAGRSGPIFHSRVGFEAWREAGRPTPLFDVSKGADGVRRLHPAFEKLPA